MQIVKTLMEVLLVLVKVGSMELGLFAKVVLEYALTFDTTFNLTDKVYFLYFLYNIISGFLKVGHTFESNSMKFRELYFAKGGHEAIL